MLILASRCKYHWAGVKYSHHPLVQGMSLHSRNIVTGLVSPAVAEHAQTATTVRQSAFPIGPNSNLQDAGQPFLFEALMLFGIIRSGTIFSSVNSVALIRRDITATKVSVNVMSVRCEKAESRNFSEATSLTKVLARQEKPGNQYGTQYFLRKLKIRWFD
jgi:hypothetical protein